MANTRVAVSFSQDHQRSADARVRFKIGAMAYADAMHLGDPELAGAGLVQLCELAVRYYASLTGSGAIGRCALAAPEVVQQLNRLRLAALGYANARHGSDSCIELARDALGALCVAAIAYCEAILGAEPSRPGGVVDRTLHLDG